MQQPVLEIVRSEPPTAIDKIVLNAAATATELRVELCAAIEHRNALNARHRIAREIHERAEHALHEATEHARTSLGSTLNRQPTTVK